MASLPDPDTLFHLVPVNHFASQAIHDPKNARFVSLSRDGRRGLEVGFHVPSVPRPPLITTLGEDADLALRVTDFTNSMCKIHAAFEINIQSRLVVLSVKSKTISTVTYAVASKATGVAERKDQGGTQSPQGKAPPSISTRNSFLGGGGLSITGMSMTYLLHSTTSAWYGYTTMPNPKPVLFGATRSP